MHSPKGGCQISVNIAHNDCIHCPDRNHHFELHFYLDTVSTHYLPTWDINYGSALTINSSNKWKSFRTGLQYRISEYFDKNENQVMGWKGCGSTNIANECVKSTPKQCYEC